MEDLLRRAYRGIGLHAAPPGTLLHRIDRQIRSRFARRPVAPAIVPMPLERPDITGVLMAFKVSGGIGDHLIAARYIRDLLAAVGSFRFDVYSSRPEVATWVFAHFEQLNNCYDEYFSWHGRGHFRHYPLAMWVSQFIVIYYDEARWLTVRQQRPKMLRVCETIDRFRQARDMDAIIHAHPRLDGLLGSKAVFANLNRFDFSHAMSGIAYGGHTLPIARDDAALSGLGLAGREYITVHNGFDAEFNTGHGVAQTSTKVYPHFEAVLARVRERWPGLLIVQLGASTSTPLRGVDVQLIGKTSLPQTASILAGAALHVDNESGLVHLAACVGTTSCVVFGPTSLDYFGYAGNINVAPEFCGGCWWSTKDWMTTCPRGFAGPKCLSDTRPDGVAESILAFLGDRPSLCEPGAASRALVSAD